MHVRQQAVIVSITCLITIVASYRFVLNVGIECNKNKAACKDKTGFFATLFNFDVVMALGALRMCEKGARRKLSN